VHRGDADDLAGRAGQLRSHTPAQELADRFPRAQELTGQVDVDHLPPLRERHLVQRGVDLQPGVVDQDVHRAEGVARLAEQRLHLRFVAHVALDGDGAPTLGFNLFDDGKCTVVAGDVVHHHRRAGLR